MLEVTLHNQKKYSHVIWDWNGTLFNDVSWCMKTINTMLGKRDLTLLNTISDYHKVFCFPIIEYYKNVGFDFDKEPFEQLAKEFIKLYHTNNTGNSQLSNNAEFVLEKIKSKGIKQVILSASEIDNLLSQFNEFDIACYFDEVLGLIDIYAKSKIDIGINYITRSKIKNAILVGDTEHDFEVANALNVECLLIANGHQSKCTLSKCGVPVLDDITQVLEYI